MTQSMQADDVEALTRQYGRDLFARLETEPPVLFAPRWWDERMMAWSMDNEDLKLQLFRFIDVLPILQTPAQITRHLREYLGHPACPLPLPAKWGLKLLPEDGVLGRLVAETARTNARRMARRFIAGTNVAETLDAIASLRRQQMTFTVDLLGEAVLTEPEARHYQRAYLELVDGLTRQVNQWPVVDQIDRDHLGPLPRVNISIK